MPHLAQLRRLAGWLDYSENTIALSDCVQPAVLSLFFLGKFSRDSHVGTLVAIKPSTQASRVATDTLLFAAAH